MRRILAGRVLGIIALAAVAVPVVSPVASAKPSPARTNLVKAVKTADKQAKKLITRSAACPAAAAQRRVTVKVRAAQTKRLAKASPSSLRLRQVRISVHAQRLAVALSKCSGGTAPGGTRHLPASPGADGANGSSGAQVSTVPLASLGENLNAGSLLGGALLPAVIPVVDMLDLGTSPTCVASGAVCLGVDRTGLVQGLTDAVSARTQELPLLAGVLDPLLAQVSSTLASQGPAALIDIERTGDRTFVVTATPGSALESLTNLLGNTGGLPAISIGTIQVRA